MDNFFKGLKAQQPGQQDNYWRDRGYEEEFEIDNYPDNQTPSLYMVKVIFPNENGIVGHTYTNEDWTKDPDAALEYSITFEREVQGIRYRYLGSVIYHDERRTDVRGQRILLATPASDELTTTEWIPTRPPG